MNRVSQSSHWLFLIVVSCALTSIGCTASVPVLVSAADMLPANPGCISALESFEVVNEHESSPTPAWSAERYRFVPFNRVDIAGALKLDLERYLARRLCPEREGADSFTVRIQEAGVFKTLWFWDSSVVGSFAAITPAPRPLKIVLRTNVELWRDGLVIGTYPLKITVVQEALYYGPNVELRNIEVAYQEAVGDFIHRLERDFLSKHF